MIASLLLLAAVLAAPQLQERVPADPGAPAAQAPRESEGSQRRAVREEWSRLSPDERRRIEERRADFRRLPPEAREEMHRRFRLLEEHRRRVFRELPEETRQRIAALPPEQRSAALDEIVRGRMRERAERFLSQNPGEAGALRDRPLDERLRHGRELRLRRMREALDERVRWAEGSGWLGPKALEWLRQAPPHEALQVIAQLRKWETLEGLQADDGWQRLGLDEVLQRRLTELPPYEFFRALEHLRRGGRPDELEELLESRSRTRFEAWERGPGPRERLRRRGAEGRPPR